MSAQPTADAAGDTHASRVPDTPGANVPDAPTASHAADTTTAGPPSNAPDTTGGTGPGAGADGSTPRRRATDPDPVRLARGVAAAYLEVEAHRRPLAQLEPILAPALRARLAATMRHAPRGVPGPALHSVLNVRADQPARGAVDAAVVVRRGERVGALTVRLERHRGAWRVVELSSPEAGLPAARTRSLPDASLAPDAFDQVLGRRSGSLRSR